MNLGLNSGLLGPTPLLNIFFISWKKTIDGSRYDDYNSIPIEILEMET